MQHHQHFQKEYATYEQQNENNKMEQPQQIQAQSSEGVSQHLQNYLHLMNMSDLNTFKSYQQNLLRRLQSQKYITSLVQDTNFDFKIVDFTRNYEYLFANVLYNRFHFHIRILNIDEQSQIHKVEKCHTGNFSTVYHIRHQGQNIAVKCHRYKKHKFLKVFKNALLQYLSLIILNKFENGPRIQNVFGFDLLVYKNCIEFSMQFCRHEPRIETIQDDLRLALLNMHCLKIIHFDIKPENICFSQKFNRNVFIDFGLHRVIKEEIGQKTLTPFTGSLLFCSQEMKKCYFKGSMKVDLYYNDAYCLQKSIQQIKRKPVLLQISQRKEKQLNKSQMLKLIKVKYSLINLNNIQNQSKKIFQKTIMELRGDYLQSMKKFISYFIYSDQFQCKIKQIEILNTQFGVKSILHTKFYSQFNKNLEKQQKEDEQENIFKNKMSKLNFLKNQNNILGKMPLKNSFKEYIQFLSNPQSIKTWQISLYLRFFSELVQINSWKVDKKNRDNLYNAFNEVLLKIGDFKALSAKEKIKKCFGYISHFIEGQLIMDDCLVHIINNSLVSILLLQIYSQQQLVHFFKNIMSIKCTIQKQVRIFINLLSCIQWTKFINTIYCYCFLKDNIYKLMISKQIKSIQPQNQNSWQLFVLQLMKFLVLIAFKNPLTILKGLLSILNLLYQIQSFNILNFYQPIREQQQIFAQIFVNCTCFLFSGSNSMPYIGELLKLQFYQKQEQLCIFHYYQFYIYSVLSWDFLKNQQTILSAFSQLRQNFKCFQKVYLNVTHQSQYFYIDKMQIYFNKIDFPKFKNSLGLFNLFQAIQCYYSLIFQKKPQLSNHRIDKSQFLAIIGLNQFYQFLEHTITISNLQFYQYVEPIVDFGLINSIFCKYILIMLKLGFQISIVQIRRHILSSISRIKSLKTKIYFHIIHLTQFYQKRLSFYDQQQILSLIISMLKQKFTNTTYIYRLMRALCILSSKKYHIEKLFMQYIVQANPQTFFCIQGFNVDFQVRTINTLWTERHIKVEGDCLYFKNIFLLCKFIATTKLRQKKSLQYFFKIIYCFLINYVNKSQTSQANYKQFAQFNTNYLLQNGKLKSQLHYPVIYFAIILPQQTRLFKTQNWLYYIIWSHLHKFCFLIRQFLNIYAFRSFLNNQLLFSSNYKRRIHYLQLKIHKMRQNEMFYRLSQKQSYVKHLQSKLRKIRKHLGKRHRKYRLIVKHVSRYYAINI